VAQVGRAPGSYPGRCRFDACRSHSEGLPPARYPVSKTGRLARALGVRLPLLPLIRSGVVETERRAAVNRERQVRALPPEPPAPVVETAMTPGPQPGSCGFESRRGCSLFASGCRGEGHPAGFGRRRPQVRFLPARLRGRGAVVLASLMSSRPWVRIPPAHSTGT
jgi:hypothetical protein